MEYLRWILLAAGIFFILVIYLFGRNRRRRNDIDDYRAEDEVPEFSARDWDDLEEGVGEVRIIARDPDEYDFEQDNEQPNTNDFDESSKERQHDESTDVASTDQNDRSSGRQTDTSARTSTSDIIVLHILAHSPDKLSGDKINAALRANGLVFGRMNIFHRLDDNDQPVFSIANMIEPGSFDPKTMHQMQTPGLTLFMQLSHVSDPEAALDDMLTSAYHVAELLDAQLCNRRRQALTQKDAEEYREQVASVSA